MDGAGRMRQAVSITLPSIMGVVVILLILRIGNIMDAGFEEIFNLYNPVVYSTGDIIDTYVYRVGLEQFDYSYSTAIGLFKNVVGLVLLVGTNLFVRRVSEHGIWYDGKRRARYRQSRPWRPAARGSAPVPCSTSATTYSWRRCRW